MIVGKVSDFIGRRKVLTGLRYVIISNKKKSLRDNWRILVQHLQQTFQNNNKLT